MFKGYKVRLYPTKEQEELMWKHIHASRFIWNYMLRYQIDNHSIGTSYLSAYSMMKMLAPLKKQEKYSWLNEVSNKSLQIVCCDLGQSFQRYFKLVDSPDYKNLSDKTIKKLKKENRQMSFYDRVGFPEFKSSKYTRKSFPVRYDYTKFTDSTHVKVEKLKSIRTEYNNFSHTRLYNPRISYVNNKWILSFALECESQAVKTTDIPMGIDLGIKEYAVVSFGNQKIVYHNINNSKRVRALQRKKKHIQRVRDRKYRTNGNYEKTKGILKYESIEREINRKLANIRKDYTHKIIHELISLLPSKVTMEKLSSTDMCKNKYVAREIANLNFYDFYRWMKYKSEWYGIEFCTADMYYPSSKLCSRCGNKKKHLSLSSRIYNCAQCGLSIDRDYNAAINLMKYVPHNERVTA